VSGQPQSLARATTGEEGEAWLGKIEELVVAELAAGATEIDIPGDAAGAERNSTAIGGDGPITSAIGVRQGLGRLVWHDPYRSQGHVDDLLQLLSQ
jgi:hypothetical protein